MSTNPGIHMDSVKAELSKTITNSIAPKLEEMKDYYETIIQGLSYQLTNANERATEAERRVRNFEAWLELASGVKQAVGKTMGETSPSPSPLKQLQMERDEANARVLELEEEVKRLNIKKERRKSTDSFVRLKESVC